jgi:hypothetical protein
LSWYKIALVWFVDESYRGWFFHSLLDSSNKSRGGNSMDQLILPRCQPIWCGHLFVILLQTAVQLSIATEMHAVSAVTSNAVRESLSDNFCGYSLEVGFTRTCMYRYIVVRNGWKKCYHCHKHLCPFDLFPRLNSGEPFDVFF